MRRPGRYRLRKLVVQRRTRNQRPGIPTISRPRSGQRI
jgi:hypothetical protein